MNTSKRVSKDEVLEELYAVTGVKELLKAVDKAGDILRLDIMETLDADEIRHHWWSGMRIIEQTAAQLQSRLSENFTVLNIPDSLAEALYIAKGNQLWEDFFAGLGIKAREPQPIKAKTKRAA